MNIINLILLFLAIPVGFLIAYLCKDELKAGRKWFKILIIPSLIFGIFFYLFDYIAVSFTFLFISIVIAISYIKS